MENKGSLFIVSAPSGGGKTTLVNAILKELSNVTISVSYTTRLMRPGEVEGVDYHFVDHKEFEQMIEKDLFLEHAVVFGQYYGTSRKTIETLLSQGRDVILEIDWQGARQIRKLFFDTVSIFILPPSREALLERLKKRHQDDDKVIADRVNASQIEIAKCLEYDYLILNENLPQAIHDLKTIIHARRLQGREQAKRMQALIANLVS